MAAKVKSIPVAVIILNWNGKALTEACLRSWALAVPRPQRILLVDNGSSDGSVVALKRKFPKLEVLALKDNLGFGAGNNRGFVELFKKGRTPQAVFVCNNDTEVEPGMLGLLWEALQAKPAWGLVGPKILFFDSPRIWFNGGFIRFFSGRSGHCDAGKPDGPAGGPVELPANGFITGCGMLLRSSLLRQLGGFDESYWAYAEDSDLCLRARRLGFASGLVPQARMRHRVSATFGKVPDLVQYYGKRNTLLLQRRHGIGLGAFTRGFYIVLVCGKLVWNTALGGRWETVQAVKDGLSDYFAGRTGIRKA